MRWLLAPVIASSVLLSPTASLACSFSWNPGHSPEEIRERSDLRKVRGRFELIDMEGSADENGELYEGRIFGRLITARGTGWATWQHFHRVSLDCGAYRKPLGDAQGTFYISRRKVDGRYEILLWDGAYLPANEMSEKAEGDS